jgi:hypothetical protein
MPPIANVTLKEPLINSGPFSCAVKKREIKTPIADNSQSKAGPMSGASVLGLAKIGNLELAYFNRQMLMHELIRGSLSPNHPRPTNINPPRSCL